MPAGELSRMVPSSRSNCSLCERACSWSVTSSVTTDVVRLPEASWPGSTRVQQPAQSELGMANGVARLCALTAPHRLLDPFVSRQRGRRDHFAAYGLHCRLAGGDRSRRRGMGYRAGSDPAGLLERRDTDAGGVHQRTDLHAYQVAFFLDAHVLHRRHVTSMPGRRLVATHQRARTARPAVAMFEPHFALRRRCPGFELRVRCIAFPCEQMLHFGRRLGQRHRHRAGQEFERRVDAQ